MIVVMGATGRTGRRITRLLITAGESVRALGRTPARLAELERLGAEIRAGDASDPAFMADAFRGADSAFTLLPYDPVAPGYLDNQRRLGESIVAAARETGLPHLVAYSSIGAEHPSGTGFVASLHAHEQRLETLDHTAVLILRAASLFENFHWALDSIRHDGVIRDTLAPEVRLPMIATRDVAEVAARALVARDWSGAVVRELLGERDLSYADATSIIGARIGNPGLRYLQISGDDMMEALVGAGFAEDFARLHVELNAAISAGRVRSVEGRNAANCTPTSFEEFAEELADAYQPG